MEAENRHYYSEGLGLGLQCLVLECHIQRQKFTKLN